jgi:PilZ domain
MDQERRRSPRFPLIAAAEVHEERNGTQLSARISDISATGCYVDTINPLSGGTAVRVKIFNEAQSFEASAIVAYSLRIWAWG